MDPAQDPRQPGLAAPPAGQPAPAAPAAHEHAPAVWLARGMMVVFVAFCIEIGLVLVAVPWLPSLWHENSLLAPYPDVRAFLAHDFVRGAVSGLGLLDIWLGIWEGLHYRDPKP
jgi:hypothetical protein